MIERYEYPEIKKIFSDEHRFEIYLKIEKLCTAAFYNFTQNIVSKEGYENIVNCDETIDLESIRIEESMCKHEMFAFIYYIQNRLNDEGKKYFHYGLTSSDVLDTGNSVIIKEANELIETEIKKLIKTLYKKATENKNVRCIGRTHGQDADFTTMGLRFLQWTEEIIRQYNRFISAANDMEQCKISGAIGNYNNIDPQIEQYVAQTLELKTDYLNTQVVSRDIYSNYFSVLGNFASSIDKLSTDIRNLARSEINELSEGFTLGQRGSSAMPHKRNPIGCENLSGCARLMRGYVVSAMENVVLWDERDMSNSITERFLMSDMIQLFYYMIRRFTNIIESLKVNKEKIYDNIVKTNELLYSQQVLKVLVNYGYNRISAYDIVKECSETAVKQNIPLTKAVIQKIVEPFAPLDEKSYIQEALESVSMGYVNPVPYSAKLFNDFELKYKSYIE